MSGDFENGIEWVLEYIYIPHNIVHFLDLFKLTNELILISENIVNYCGTKEMFLGLKEFCDIDPERCSLPMVLTNTWWRMGIIIVLALRIFSNDIELIVYASEKDEDPDAASESAETMYEMGEDFGTILKYILDFRVTMDTKRSEFDNN
mgnify:FL=1